MRALTAIAAVAAILAPASTVLAGTPPAPTTTRAAAERKILGARRVLGSWRAGLTDPSSGLLRRNTTVTCTGSDRRRGPRHSVFSCVLRHGTATVAVTYVTLRHNGFELVDHQVLHR